MDSSSLTEPLPALRCRLRLTLDAGDGSVPEVDIDLEQWLRGPFDKGALLHLPNRVSHVLETRLVPTARRALHRCVDEKVPVNPEVFEDEFVRRCDHNDEVVSALDWIDSDVDSEEEIAWKSRMVEIVMARWENEEVR